MGKLLRGGGEWGKLPGGEGVKNLQRGALLHSYSPPIIPDMIKYLQIYDEIGFAELQIYY